MSIKIIPISILITIIGVLAFYSRVANADQSPDAQVITQLKKAGSNLSKPHLIEFYLYFPSQSSAEKVGLTLKDKGFITKVGLSAQGTDWLLLATKPMRPTESSLVSLRKELTSVASAEGGEYDGWGTPIVH